MAGNNPTAARRSSYAEKLKDPRWQKKRLEVLQRDQWACRLCDATDKTLHVHHRIYLPYRDPWEYDEAFLETLCADCHEGRSDLRGDIDDLLTALVKSSPYPDVFGELAFTVERLGKISGTDQPRAYDAAVKGIQNALVVQHLVRMRFGDAVPESEG